METQPTKCNGMKKAFRCDDAEKAGSVRSAIKRAHKYIEGCLERAIESHNNKNCFPRS